MTDQTAPLYFTLLYIPKSFGDKMASKHCELCGYGMAAKATNCAYCRKRPEFRAKMLAKRE
jgi:hypothetical protein